MARKILLDTNAYLRLGGVFYPLLLEEISGDEGGELWILAELYQELQRSHRLRTEFTWTWAPEVVANRKQCRWRLEEEVRNEIDSVYEFAVRYSQAAGNSASPFDIRCLAYGLVLGITVVTDDRDMRLLGDELEVVTISTLQLLHRMLTTGFCTIDQIHATVRYWIAVGDLPRNYKVEYQKLFGEPAPNSPY